MAISIKNKEIIEEKLTFLYGEKRSKKTMIEIEKLFIKYSKNNSFHNRENFF